MTRHTIGRPMEVLLVEDNLVDAKLTISALNKGGLRHRLTLVRDGEEALEFLFQRGRFAHAPRPDLILLDLFLPLKDGLEVLAEIKNDYDLTSIPVVVLTAAEAADIKVRCELLDVEHYLSKPVNFDKFLNLVRKLKSHWRHDLILPMLE